MSKKIVVFGGTGGVGAYTCTRLIEIGYEVVVVGHRQNDNNFFETMGATYVSVDIINKETFNSLPQDNIYGIIHLAGMLPARMKGYKPQTYIDCNMTGTLNVLEYAVMVKAERFIYAQSISDVHYLVGTTTPIPANAVSKHPTDNDHSVYSITKTAAMHLVEHYAVHHGFKQFSLRFPNIYLYNPNPTYYVDGILRVQGLRRIINDIEHGKDVDLWGNPNRVRDMIYIKDCVQIIEKCLTADSNGGTFNIGTGIGTTRLEQMQRLVDIYSPTEGKRSQIFIKEDQPNSPQYIMDVSKTKSELGYEPQYSYRDSLVDMKKEKELERFAPIWGKESDFDHLF